ncbi:MAG TPA: hypothetical protein VL096_22025 [Pirellulaceae bacterium]|nr:hypothetical protein [Pirellulaceae bacterium]
MQRLCLISVTAGALVALTLVLSSAEWNATSHDQQRSTSTQLAARYHLRTRTSDFYARAKPGGSTSNRKPAR